MRKILLLAVISVVLGGNGVHAQIFSFSTGSPDGRLATASRPDSSGKIEIESADDFLLTNSTQITSATFTGLIPTGASLADIGEVQVEIYRVFPLDSTVPPSGNVPTRNNSPSDVAFDSRSSLAVGELSFTPTILNPNFTAANSILNGINKKPNQNTLGEGPVTGQEVLFSVTLTTPFNLPADHYFFIPQVQLPTGQEFYWLSTSRAVPLFPGDLQAWIRNANLVPDWLREGTDIIGGDPAPTFNEAFTLDGVIVPDSGSTGLLFSAALGVIFYLKRRLSLEK